MPSRLTVVLPDSIIRQGKDLYLDPKTLSGLNAYAANWPGELTVIATPSRSTRVTNLNHATESELAFSIVTTDNPLGAAHRRGSVATLALHTISNAPLMEFDPRRIIWTTENPLRQRLSSSFIGSNAINGIRSSIGHLRRAAPLWSMIRRAGGIQCNGYPTWNAYSHHSANPMLFFDTRVSDKQINDSQKREYARNSATRPLTVAFSGRHIPIKGPQYALAAFDACSRDDYSTLFINGHGEMTESLQTKAAFDNSRTSFTGYLEYESEWTAFVRENVDLMILPHTQGDPAGSYLEAAALGVPVIGFNNAALTPLTARHGIGWTVPMRRADRLTLKLRELANSPSEIRAAGQRGIDFMSQHTFETEFRRRILHLREVAQH
ncbi:glycosyltransferase [Brevibacterium yomogidense]|uniref:glycosyltransferase n=1 Tax=Brevibacterium yomogidense TaxID=946573 RepID=UPI0018DFD77E|nr:glycosyltransferase [Brevibacterium yomogidense]